MGSSSECERRKEKRGKGEESQISIPLNIRLKQEDFHCGPQLCRRCLFRAICSISVNERLRRKTQKGKESQISIRLGTRFEKRDFHHRSELEAVYSFQATGLTSEYQRRYGNGEKYHVPMCLRTWTRKNFKLDLGYGRDAFFKQ